MQYFLSVVMSLLGVSERHCGFWRAGCLALDDSVLGDVHSGVSFTSLGERKAFWGILKSCWSKHEASLARAPQTCTSPVGVCVSVMPHVVVSCF